MRKYFATIPCGTYICRLHNRRRLPLHCRQLRPRGTSSGVIPENLGCPPISMVTCRRLHELNAVCWHWGAAPLLSRGMRAMLSIRYTALLANVAESPYSLLWSALYADGAKVSSILENGVLREATISDGLGALQTLLGSWYFFSRHRGAPPLSALAVGVDAAVGAIDGIHRPRGPDYSHAPA
jgi:hypothetical protein